MPTRNMGNRLIDEIINELKKGINVALIAPTGWGKTRLAFQVIAELAKMGYKIAYAVPTLTLAVHKWEELVSFSPPSAILTAGAAQYCVYRWNYPQRHCNRCSMGKSTDVDVPKIVTYFELNKLVPDHVCAYWVQEAIMHRYSVIVGHYGRLGKILRYVHFLVADEVQERYLPFIESKPLSEIAELLSIDADQLTDVSVIKELAEERLTADPLKEDELYTLLQLLKKTCWIEDGVLYCMELYDLTHNIPEFAITATPPPGWPPEGWGRKIVIEPRTKPKAYIEPSADFYYKDGYSGIGLHLYMIIKWLKQKFGTKCVIIFATSSVRNILRWNLPQASYEPPKDETQIPPSGVVIVDAWGRMRVGVDIRYCDAAVLPWPALHVVARRRLKAEGKNPDTAELILSVQHAGRIMRPRPGETYEDAIRRKIVVFAAARFWRHKDYLTQHFDIEELPAEL